MKKREKKKGLPSALKKEKEEKRKRRWRLNNLKNKGQKNPPAKVKNTKLVQRYSGKRGN